MDGTRKWSTKWYAMTVAFTLTVVAFAGGGRALAQDTTPPPMSSSPPPVGGTVGYFGEHGQVVISGDFRFDILRESRSMGGGSSTSYQFQPALDYFASTNLSIGALLGVRRDVTGLGNATTFTFAPRVGYNLVLSSAVTLWVRAGIGYERASVGELSGYAIPFFLNAPFLWHPVSHFFIGAGPFFSTDLVSKTGGEDDEKRTNIGLASIIGGYFGGP